MQRPGNEEAHCILGKNFRVAGAQGRGVGVKNESREASGVRSQGLTYKAQWELSIHPEGLNKESLSHTAWMNLKHSIYAKQGSQSQKDKHCMIPLP